MLQYFTLVSFRHNKLLNLAITSSIEDRMKILTKIFDRHLVGTIRHAYTYLMTDPIH